MQPGQMAYDRAITVFSPDGRLFQVEYAREAVKRGTTTVGLKFDNGVALIIDKRITSKLVVSESIEKIFQIDDHIGATASGILSDARVLIERAQLKAQQHKVTFDSPIDTLSIVKDMCNIKQICTQSGGLRPFGVSILVAGIDNDGPKLYETDPTGIYFRYVATSIGEGEVEVDEILHKNYNTNLTVEEGLKVAVKALSKVLGTEFNIDRLDCAYIKTEQKKFKKFSKQKLEKILGEAKKGKK